MVRIVALIILLVCLIATGCGNGDDVEPTPTPTATTTPTPSPTATPTSTPTLPKTLTISNPSINLDQFTTYEPDERISDLRAQDDTYVYLVTKRDAVEVQGPAISIDQGIDLKALFHLDSESIVISNPGKDHADGFTVKVNSELSYSVAIDDFEYEVNLAQVNLKLYNGYLTSTFVFAATADGVAKNLLISDVIDDQIIEATLPLSIEAGPAVITTPTSTPTPIPTPSAPSTLSVTAISSSRIDIHWQDNSANETGFRIERSRYDTPWTYVEIAVVGKDVNTYSDTGLEAGWIYHYRVRSYNEGGNSPYSNIAYISTLAATPTSTTTATPTSTPTATPTSTPTPTPTPIPGGPDLEVQDVAIDWVTANSTYTISFKICNIGNVSTNATCIGIHIDGAHIYDIGLAILYPNQCTPPLYAGSHEITGDSDTIIICADQCNLVDEGNEDNNCVETVFPPPPATPTPTPTPTSTTSTTPDHKDERSGCFIATAASSDPDNDSSVQTLRSFRDGHLLNNSVGTDLVNIYYKISPPVAEFIDDNPALKPAVRIGLLPAASISSVSSDVGLAVKIPILAFILLCSITTMLWLRSKVRKNT